MGDLIFVEPTELYNLLQQKMIYSNLSDSNFLLLIDCRNRRDYNESHILTAKRIPYEEDSTEFAVPFGAEIECKLNVIVYDGSTKFLKDKESAAIVYAKFLWNAGSRNPVQILRGGYETFSRLYPFLRTQVILYTQRELDDLQTYPYEIIPQKLYIGTHFHATQKQIAKDLNLTCAVCCSTKDEMKRIDELGGLCFTDKMVVDISDDVETNLFPQFKKLVYYIGSKVSSNKKPVLICSYRGSSRSAAIAMAFLIQRRSSLEKAYRHVTACCFNAEPNSSFMAQLARWEEEIFDNSVRHEKINVNEDFSVEIKNRESELNEKAETLPE